MDLRQIHRRSEFSFWQSVPAAFIGSYVWETTGESLDFSINDFVNTCYGKVIIGEVSNRFANRIVNQRSTYVGSGVYPSKSLSISGIVITLTSKLDDESFHFMSWLI